MRKNFKKKLYDIIHYTKFRSVEQCKLSRHNVDYCGNICKANMLTKMVWAASF